MNFNYVKIMSTPNKETEQIDSPKERKSHFYLTVTKVLIPAASVMDLQTVPPDLLVKVQPVFYTDPTDALFKALGVN